MRRNQLLMCAAVVAVVVSLASQAAAQEEKLSYIEMGYGRVELQDPDLALNTVFLRGGTRFGDHFGVEAEGGLGVGTETASVAGFRVQARLNWSASIYGVAALPVSENSELLLRAGFATVELEADAGAGAVTGTADGPAAGIGYRTFPGSGRVGWRVDYTHQWLENADTDSISVSLVARF